MMSSFRHVSLPLFLGVSTILALVSCQLSAPRALPPEEVLRRTIISNALREEVGIDGRLHVVSDAFSGSLLFSGGIENAGVSWWGRGSVRIIHTSLRERSTFSGAVSLLSLDHRTLGVRLDSAQGMLADRLLATIVRSDAPPWLLFTFGTGSVALMPHAQIGSESVDVLLGSIRITSASPVTRNSFQSYVYTVSVETLPEGLSEPWKGELLIDARTFELLSVHWRAPAKVSAPSISVDEIVLQFTDRIALQKPRVEGAVVPLTFQSLTDIILGKPLVP